MSPTLDEMKLVEAIVLSFLDDPAKGRLFQSHWTRQGLKVALTNRITNAMLEYNKKEMTTDNQA